MTRHPVAYLKDNHAWHTLYRTFQLSDYLPDDYAYRVGTSWTLARPSRRLPRGVCLRRREGRSPRGTDVFRSPRKKATLKTSKTSPNSHRVNNRIANFADRKKASKGTARQP